MLPPVEGGGSPSTTMTEETVIGTLHIVENSVFNAVTLLSLQMLFALQCHAGKSDFYVKTCVLFKSYILSM